MSAAAAYVRRGACPALYAPMQTGDGLLIRLRPVADWLTPQQFSGLCRTAEQHGNGIIEITARGNFQVRGLSEESATRFSDDIARLEIDVRTGVPVEKSPLAALDPAEIADPGPMALAIEAEIESAGLTSRLGPKVSVLVDGGGSFSLDNLAADIRLRAAQRKGRALWRISIAGDARTETTIGAASQEGAVGFAIDLLTQIAELGVAARATDLFESATHEPAAANMTGHPNVGVLPLRDGRFALSVGLALGRSDARSLEKFAELAEMAGVDKLCPAPGRLLIAILPSIESVRALLDTAGSLGLITRGDDPRLAISACAGAPACGSAHFDTKAVAEIIAADQSELIGQFGDVHISGCAKGCAHPAPAGLTIVGSGQGVGLVVNGTARQQPTAYLPLKKASHLPAAFETALAEINAYRTEK